MSDARVAAWTCAWNAITAAQELRQPPKTKGLRVAPDPLPELYWAAIAEAAVYAELARADLSVGQQALTMINAFETAKESVIDTLTDIFGVPRPGVGDPISDAADEAEHRDAQPDQEFECPTCSERATVDTPTGWRCTECGSSDDHTEPDAVSITAEGVAVVESGLTLRQAHELKTGCAPNSLCAECR